LLSPIEVSRFDIYDVEKKDDWYFEGDFKESSIRCDSPNWF